MRAASAVLGFEVAVYAEMMIPTATARTPAVRSSAIVRGSSMPYPVFPWGRFRSLDFSPDVAPVESFFDTFGRHQNSPITVFSEAA
jgi:hypothetical protein